MEIRNIQPGDYPALCRIWQQGIDGNLATFRDAPPSFADWDAAHDPDCRLLALAPGDTPLGFAAVTPHGGCRAYRGVGEISLYVDTAQQGRGVGGALLSALIALGERQGYHTLEAVIIRENLPSLRLFSRHGFRTVGYRERIAYTPDGVWHDTVILEYRSRSLDWEVPLPPAPAKED